MSAYEGAAVEWAIRKLERLADLSDDDRRAVASLPYRIANVSAGHHLIREGTETTECCLLVSGYACRHKLTATGARQIVSFHVRGDILDIQHLMLSVADHNVQTITDAAVAWVPMAQLRRLAWERPALGQALWRDTLIDASIFREWVLNVGRRDAKSRIAHMLCEMAARCEATGLGPASSFQLPMTQEQIGDATGLTPVHVNRMMRSLTDDGVIVGKGRQMQINDWTQLQRIAGFDPAYLHAAA